MRSLVFAASCCHGRHGMGLSCMLCKCVQMQGCRIIAGHAAGMQRSSGHTHMRAWCKTVPAFVAFNNHLARAYYAMQAGRTRESPGNEQGLLTGRCTALILSLPPAPAGRKSQRRARRCACGATWSPSWSALTTSTSSPCRCVRCKSAETLPLLCPASPTSLCKG